MTIDLKTPTQWSDLTTDQLRDVVELAAKDLSREEYLLILMCKFSGIKMVTGGFFKKDDHVVQAQFKTADGRLFTLEDWQVTEFCERLSVFFDIEKLPIEIAWPFKWDKYLMDTTFGDWFHADALLLGYSMTGDIEQLKGAMKDLGDPRDDLQPDNADLVLMLKWYDSFKDWLQERYPLVFQKAEPGAETPTTPIEARQNIMLMLNDGRPQDNEAIEKSNVHDVLAALQHKIEYAKDIEEKLRKIKP